MAKKLYQIQIVLKESKPKIWRRILIPSDLMMFDFHRIIQITMGWKNYHLHQFIKNGKYYNMRMEEEDCWDEMDNVDYKNVKLSNLLKREKQKMDYEYDFGDSWKHEIILEKNLPFDKDSEYPICLSGERNCPPEDCGGIWGYTNLLKILEGPKNEEYESYMEWLGGEFDPEHFDKDEINKLLKQIDL